MESVDVVIVGGSHAGLSAAMALGRLRRSALVVDAGNPRNKVSNHANNIAGLDGASPSDLRARAKEDLKKYESIRFQAGAVTAVTKLERQFEVTLDSGKQLCCRKIILAFGVEDRLPKVKGLQELWGGAVFHCPYCHGYEFKDKALGFIGNGQFAEHMVPMLLNISKNVALFTQGPSDVSTQFVNQLSRHHIKLYEDPIILLQSASGILKSVLLSSGTQVKMDGLVVGPQPPLQLGSSIADQLGCKKDEMGFIVVGKLGETSIVGVFAAGDIMSMQHSVVGAAATGQMAGSGAVFQLSQEDF